MTDDKINPVSWMITVNPSNHQYLGGLDPQKILDACGMIPSFVASYQSDTNSGFMDHLNACYPFGIYPLDSGRVNKETLAFQFPQDPDQWPYIALVGSFPDAADDLMVLVYPHSMVAILQDDGEKQTIFRMD